MHITTPLPWTDPGGGSNIQDRPDRTAHKRTPTKQRRKEDAPRARTRPGGSARSAQTWTDARRSPACLFVLCRCVVLLVLVNAWYTPASHPTQHTRYHEATHPRWPRPRTATPTPIQTTIQSPRRPLWSWEAAAVGAARPHRHRHCCRPPRGGRAGGERGRGGAGLLLLLLLLPLARGEGRGGRGLEGAVARQEQRQPGQVL